MGCGQGCLNVRSDRVLQWRNASKRQHPLDVVGQLSGPWRMDREPPRRSRFITMVRRSANTGAPVRLASRWASSPSWASRAQCHSFSMLQRCRTSRSRASGLVRRLVSHREVRLFNPPRGAVVQPTKMAPDAALTAAPRHGVADHPHDPGTAGPVRLDVLGRLFGMQFPDSVSPVHLLMIRCRERAPAFSLELATDLAVEGSAGWLSQSGGRRTPAPGTGFVGVEGLLSQGDAKGAGVERDLGCIDAVCRMR